MNSKKSIISCSISSNSNYNNSYFMFHDFMQKIYYFMCFKVKFNLYQQIHFHHVFNKILLNVI